MLTSLICRTETHTDIVEQSPSAKLLWLNCMHFCMPETIRKFPAAAFTCYSAVKIHLVVDIIPEARRFVPPSVPQMFHDLHHPMLRCAVPYAEDAQPLRGPPPLPAQYPAGCRYIHCVLQFGHKADVHVNVNMNTKISVSTNKDMDTGTGTDIVGCCHTLR